MFTEHGVDIVVLCRILQILKHSMYLKTKSKIKAPP